MGFHHMEDPGFGFKDTAGMIGNLLILPEDMSIDLAGESDWLYCKGLRRYQFP